MKIFELVNKGVGNYGLGGTALIPEDVLLISPLQEAPSDNKIKGRRNGAWVDARAVHIFYADQAAMLADQSNQEEGRIYFDGTADWIKKSTSTGVIGDYRSLGGGGGSIDQDNKVRVIQILESALPAQYRKADVLAHLNTLGITISDKEIIAIEVVTDPFVNLISYYKLDETTGTIAADTEGLHNGTISNATLGVAGKIGTAFTFSGADTSFVNLGNSAAFQLNTGSLSCWVKTAGAGAGYRGLFAKRLASNLYLRDNVLITYDWTANVDRSTGINIANNTWRHVVLTFEAGTLNNKIYLDGAVVLENFAVGNFNQANSLFIASGDSANQRLAGTMDECAVFNTKITAENVEYLYNSGAGRTR